MYEQKFRLKILKSYFMFWQILGIFFINTKDGLVIRKQGAELHFKPIFLVTAEIYLNICLPHTFDPNISDFYDLCLHWASVVRVLRESSLMMSLIRVGRGVQDSPKKGTLKARQVGRQVGRQVKNGQKTWDVINERSLKEILVDMNFLILSAVISSKC